MTLGGLDQPAVLWSFADYILYKQVSEELYGFTGLQEFPVETIVPERVWNDFQVT